MFEPPSATASRARRHRRATAEVLSWASAVVLLLAPAVGCSKPGQREGAPDPGNAPRDLPGPIPTDTTQLVVGISADWDATAVELRLFDRTAGGAWTQKGEPWAGRIGRSGLAWGRGLHGDGSPPDFDGPIKAEGDGRAPAGVFPIGHAYGYAERPLDGCRLPYTQLTEGWRCVDDPASSSYNRVLDATDLQPDWASAETMRRDDDLYAWVVEIEHNRGGDPDGASMGRPTPGAGSCIFFHVWADGDSPTAGCTAMAPNKIESLLVALRPEAQPVYVALPRDAYRRLTRGWSLPTL